MNSQEQSYTTKKNKLLQGILIGALAGAAISMLDRSTRESVIACSKKRYQQVKEIVENPEIITEQVKETSDKIRTTFETISEEVAFITEQVDVLKDLPKQVATTVKEAKDVFEEDKGE
ncbi:MAG: YtxH domain-containing protein [Bacillus sp. (in: firmicutes)]